MTSDTISGTPRGVDPANLDPDADPRDDFYQWACGGWMMRHPLPPDYARFGTFDQLREDNRRQLRELITGLDPANAAPGSVEHKIASIYAMAMDADRLNAEGASPAMADLQAIMAASAEEIIVMMAATEGVSAFFETGVQPDMADSETNVMYWMQGGLGLGDRDFYLDDTDRARAVRQAYTAFLRRIGSLAGFSDSEAALMADDAMRLETRLARASMPREELRNPQAVYNPMPLADIEATYPSLRLGRYFSAQGADDIDRVIVGQPAFMAEVAAILADTPIEQLRRYVAAGYLAAAAPFLSDDFVDAKFRLNQALSGVETPKPRWKRAVAACNALLGEAVGQLYTLRYFPPASKEAMLQLVGHLRRALADHIGRVEWMSDDTRRIAFGKLEAMTVKIGYPDKWRDYSGLDIDESRPYWHNIQQAMRFELRHNIDDLHKPVDHGRWHMNPQTVNAYYSPLANEICFPAGILQPPYFNPGADAAENYGAIGVIIGHEMTHGFDDQGSRFDAEGNLREWWTPADRHRFELLADRLVRQFDAIEVAPGVHANGRFTLGENIADQGGLRVAFTAYMAAGGKNGPEILGLTPAQRFYTAYANVWAGNIRDEEIVVRTKTDPHSLGRWRVDGTLRNLDTWADAFGVTQGHAMYLPPEERVVIW